MGAVALLAAGRGRCLKVVGDDAAGKLVGRGRDAVGVIVGALCAVLASVCWGV